MASKPLNKNCLPARTPRGFTKGGAVGSQFVLVLCTLPAYIQTITLSVMSPPLLHTEPAAWGVHPAPSSFLSPTHKGSHSGGGFLCAPHPPPHHSHTIGDPFQRLLAGSLATFSSQPSLPWGCKWWKEENKDARWMLGSEVRLVAHSGPSSQPRRGWMSFFGKALREEKKLIPQPGATMMPGFSAILQRGLACDLDQGKTHYKGHSTLGLLGTNHIHLNTLNGQKHSATPINLWINVFSVPWLQWIKTKHLAPLQAFMKEWDIVH